MSRKGREGHADQTSRRLADGSVSPGRPAHDREVRRGRLLPDALCIGLQGLAQIDGGDLERFPVFGYRTARYDKPLLSQ